MGIIEYARVTTLEQNPELQEHALRQAGAIRIFTDYESGSKAQRPQLTGCLNYLRDHDGDVLVVWKLDRLGRSVRHGGRPTVMTPEHTELARTMREQGKSLDSIASTLRVGRSSVSRALAP